VQETTRDAHTETVVAEAASEGFALTCEDGTNFHRIPAEFLIDPQGVILPSRPLRPAGDRPFAARSHRPVCRIGRDRRRTGATHGSRVRPANRQRVCLAFEHE